VDTVVEWVIAQESRYHNSLTASATFLEERDSTMTYPPYMTPQSLMASMQISCDAHGVLYGTAVTRPVRVAAVMMILKNMTKSV
jgi:hypothetical protein